MMKNNFKKALLPLMVVSTLILTGCSSTNAQPITQKDKLQVNIEESINKSFKLISKDLQELNLVTRGVKDAYDETSPTGFTVNARTIKGTGKQINVSKTELDGRTKAVREERLAQLDRRINVVWNGSAADLIEKLTKDIGYKYVEQGKVIKANVKVYVKGETIKNVFGLIDDQIKDKIDIAISTKEHTVTVKFK